MPEPLPDAISEGIYLYTEGFYEHAIQQFEQALDAVETEGNWRVKAIIYCNIGECYFQGKQLSNALDNYECAYSLAKESNDSNFLAVINTYKAKVLIVQDEFNQAECCLENALELFTHLDDLHGLMVIHGLWGDLNFRRYFLNDALYHYKQAADYAHTLQNVELENLWVRAQTRLLQRAGATGTDRGGEKDPYPFIFTFPYPHGPPAASGHPIKKKLLCPSCGYLVVHGTVYCPKCAAKLPPDYYLE